MTVAAPFRFELPEDLAAREPPERRGLARDGVRLLAVDRATGAMTHSRFDRLPDLLAPGDCVVFNASRTLPAAVPARLAGASGPARPSGGDPGRIAGEVSLTLRLARRWDDRIWSVLVLDGEDNPWTGDLSGARFEAAASGKGPALSAGALERDPVIDRLWKVRFSLGGQALMESLSRLGNPVRYWYVSAPWQLDYYQTVYAREPGSVEMPSAGRAFTWRLMQRLREKGIGTAFLVLHAGLSSYMDEEFDSRHPASVEPFHLEAKSAATINAAREKGGRILAVGTTVVRALESIADPGGKVRAASGETGLRIVPGYRLKAVDGLLTGFHEPTASHLDLLTAFLAPDRLGLIYAAALERKYLWHEFGDANLIL